MPTTSTVPTPGTNTAVASPSAPLVWTRIPSPIGPLLVVGRREVLHGLYVADHEKCPAASPEWIEDADAFDEVRRQLGEYFEGTRRTFDLQLELQGSSFQRRVWHALLDVPFGHTAGYGDIARRVGRPTAARAVGAANGRNPVSIVVPCHRIVGADGSLTGYGWGTERKAWLLDHERRWL
jgi:methylated-DNA-[protein]-cysteine S-methyltransferase